MQSILDVLDQCIQKSKILGVTSKLAGILGVGYQNQIPISQQFFKNTGNFFQHSNDFFNQLRFRKKKYIFNETVAAYILNMKELHSKRFSDMFGWQPDKEAKQALEIATTWHKQKEWQQFRYEKIYDAYTEHTVIPINDEVIKILKELHLYIQQTEKINKTLHIAVENLPKIQIDIKTIYIFFSGSVEKYSCTIYKGKS